MTQATKADVAACLIRRDVLPVADLCRRLMTGKERVLSLLVELKEEGIVEATTHGWRIRNQFKAEALVGNKPLFDGNSAINFACEKCGHENHFFLMWRNDHQ